MKIDILFDKQTYDATDEHSRNAGRKESSPLGVAMNR
jgi:hypothetical protein